MSDHTTQPDQHEAITSRVRSGSMMDVARALRELRNTRPSDLLAVAAQAGMSPRKAHALARLATIFDNRGLRKNLLEEVGWAKLDIIGRYVSEDGSNIPQLLSLAESNSQLALKSKLQDDTAEDLSGKNASMLFHLPEAQGERLRALLLKYGARQSGKGLVEKEKALIAIMDALEDSERGHT